MPAAARITDLHTCPAHVGGPVASGEGTVFIGFHPAARVGDTLVCVGPPDSVSRGESTVRIGGQHAARIGDPTSHGGIIVKGCPTVLIGSSPQAAALRTDKPFCEDCESRRRAQEKKRARGK